MMAPTTEDLRATLRVMADEHPPPAPADLLDALRAERRARRARTGWIAAAGVAAAAVAAVVATQAWPEPTATDPARDGDRGVASTTWELADGQPPEYADGLHLLETVELASSGPVSLPSPPSGTQRYAVLWCETGPAIDDPAIQPPVLVLDDVDVTAACLPAERTPDAAEVDPAALPPTGEAWAASWEGDLPEGAEAVLGIYEESTVSDYPFPGWPEPLPTAPEVGDGEVSLTQDSPLSPQPVTTGEGALMVASTVVAAPGEDSTVELWTSVPGRMQVWVDGELLTDDGDDPQAWASADPALRDGAFSAFTAGQRLSIPLPAELTARREPVRISAGTAHGQPWQVRVTDVAGPAPAEAAVAPLDSGAVPDGVDEWFGGMRRLAAWQLPAGGTVAELELPEEVHGEAVTWLAACPGVEPGAGGMATITVDADDRLERGCGDPENALVGVALQQDGTELTATSRVRVGLPAQDDGSSGVVAAYVPVSYEEFEHEGARPVSELLSAEAVLRAEPEVVATLTLDDLDDEGRARLQVPEGASLLRATSTGVGRLRVTADGADGSPLDTTSRLMSVRRDDGWWTAWSDQETTQLVAAFLERRVEPGDELQIRVEGYDGGSLTLEVLAPADR